MKIKSWFNTFVQYEGPVFAAVCAVAYFSFDTVGVGLSALFTALMTLRIIFRLYRKRGQIERITLIDGSGLALLLLGIVVITHLKEKEVEESKAIGNHIITQIRDFRVQRGRYPDDLRELESAGRSIQQPKNGGTWRYNSFNTDFSFSFSAHSGMICYRNSTSTSWICD